MRRKIILAVLTLTFSINCAQIYAQNSKSPKQIKILNNYGAIPFEDGKTIIVEIKFTGLDSKYERYDETIGKRITESNFRNFLRQERAEINPDDKFYGYKVSKAAKLLRAWLAEHGYRKADVIALGEQLAKNQMRLIIDIKRGLPARVSEIRFDGNISISNEEYINKIKECSGSDWEIFNSRIYEYYTEKCLRDLMRSKGYLQGKILSVSPELENGNLVVKINLKEGIRYRIGEIKFEGIKVFTEKELLEMLNIKTGEIADGSKIMNYLYEKLKRIYADKGYILYDGEFDPVFIEPQVEGLDAVVNLNITIDEGRQFRIGKIKFLGIREREITEKEEAELKDSFPLKEKDIFNRTKFEEGIRKLNESEKFYKIDADRDVEMFTSQDSDEIELFIRIIKIDE